MIWTFSNTCRYQPPWNCCAFVSSHLYTFLCVQCDFPDVMLKGSWSVRQKISNGANVHNNDSQKRFVLFWPHKWNKNIFINSGAIYQAKCNRSCDVTSEWMHYVLARWRPTSHSSAVCGWFINCHIQDGYVWLFIITVYQWIFVLATGQPIKFSTWQNNLSEMPTSNKAVHQCWHGPSVLVTCDVTRSFCHQVAAVLSVKHCNEF